MLAIPTSLILFFADAVWGDSLWQGFVLLGSLSVPPGVALWWIERRRGRR